MRTLTLNAHGTEAPAALSARAVERAVVARERFVRTAHATPALTLTIVLIQTANMHRRKPAA
jgi:hypothetical protein